MTSQSRCPCLCILTCKPCNSNNCCVLTLHLGETALAHQSLGSPISRETFIPEGVSTVLGSNCDHTLLIKVCNVLGARQHDDSSTDGPQARTTSVVSCLSGYTATCCCQLNAYKLGGSTCNMYCQETLPAAVLSATLQTQQVAVSIAQSSGSLASLQDLT